MKLSKEFYDLLLQSFDDAIARMEQSSTNEEKLYYFSATHGNMNRIMNFYCDPLLVFMYQELQIIQKNFSARISQTTTPNNISIIGTPPEFFDALLAHTKSLKNAIIANDEDAIRVVLEKMASLSYATTGNGFYLYLLGKLII
jgi:hypothetical protein